MKEGFSRTHCICSAVCSKTTRPFRAMFFTARKSSLRRLCFYRCVSVHSVVSQNALQVASQYALQQVSGGRYPSMPCKFPDPHPRVKLRGIWPGGSPGPHPRGKLRGIRLGGVSRPTPKGEVEGDLARGGLQAHTQGGCLLWGGCLL